MSQQLKADVLLLLVTLLAALGWIFSKEALVGFAPLLFIGVRFSIAGFLLAVIGGRELRQLSVKQWRHSLGVGLFFALGMVFWILGLAYANHLGVGAFITSLGVILVPLVALFFGERPAKSTWFALPLAVIGLACLSLSQTHPLGLGDVFFMLAALVFAIYFTLNGKAAGTVSTLALAAIQLSVVGVMSLMLSGLFEQWYWPAQGDLWLWLLASVFIATSLRFFMQTWAQSLASASHCALMMTLEPVWTALLAMLWFAERMGEMQLMGCGFIFLALLVSRSQAWVRWITRSA
ncbi:MAG: DMT family transporter [Pontibacterium sp.]